MSTDAERERRAQERQKRLAQLPSADADPLPDDIEEGEPDTAEDEPPELRGEGAGSSKFEWRSTGPPDG